MRSRQKYNFLIICGLISFVLALNPFNFNLNYSYLIIGLIIIAISMRRSWIDGMFINLFFNFSFYSLVKTPDLKALFINITIFSAFAVLGDRLKLAGRKEKRLENAEEEKIFYNKITASLMAAYDMLGLVDKKFATIDIYHIFSKNISNLIGSQQTIIYSKNDDGELSMFFSDGIYSEYDIEKKLPINYISSKDFKNCEITKAPLIKNVDKGFITAIPIQRENITTGMIILYKQTSFEYSEIYIAEFLSAQLSVIVEKQELFNKNEINYEKLIEALALAIDAKDHETLGHSIAAMSYAAKISDKLNLTDEEKKKIRYAALLHDIGKININSKILTKPGALTAEEFTEIKKHPTEAVKILNKLAILNEILPLILYHHERFNGNGYPDNLKGDEIPLGARICAIADAYSVMLSDRPYKKALSKEEAISELKRCAGLQFDKTIVDIFLEIIDNEDKKDRGEDVGKTAFNNSVISSN